MWTRGKDREAPGKFAFELWAESALIYREGGFSTAQEADRAAERAQRDFLLYGALPGLPDDIGALSDDELLAELLAA